MDSMVVVALIAYIVLFCMAFYVVQGYMEESREIARQYRNRKSHQS
jgi:hypothetical protein